MRSDNEYMKYLGIDYGLRWVGFAIGDDETKLALPFETFKIESEEQLFSFCTELIQKEGIDMCVVGIPTIGAHSIDCTPYVTFSEKLSQHISIPVIFADESFSTKQAQGYLGNSNKDNHALSAMIILQSYLDHQKSHDNME